MKRLLTATLVIITFLGVLVGCGQNGSDGLIIDNKNNSSSQPVSENVAISFFGYKADAMNLIAIENALHAFMQENPGIEIKYEGAKGSSYWEAFDLRLRNNNLDDIFMVDHDTVLQLAPEGKLADLSGLDCIDEFNEMAKNQFTDQNGCVYFIPTNISTYGMYVNLDLLKENGFEVPENWSDFAEQCNYFKSQGITPIIGNNYSTLLSLMVAKGLYPVYQQENSAELIEKFNSGEADITEYLKDGVEMVGEMIANGWFDPEELLETAQTSDDLALFAKGERPFMITGGWASQRLMSMGPEFSYGVYPFPVLPEGCVLVMDVNTCISINADSEYLAEAKKFVEYFMQPDVIFEYCDTQSCYTPLQDERIPQDKTIAPSVEYLTNGESVIGSDYRLKLPLDNAERAVGEAMLKGMDTEEALELLAELLKQ